MAEYKFEPVIPDNDLSKGLLVDGDKRFSKVGPKKRSKEVSEKILESLAQNTFDDPEVRYVSTPEEFTEALQAITSAESTQNTIRLKADVDMQGAELPAVVKKDNAPVIIKGEGHAIKNAVIVEPQNKAATTNYGGGFISWVSGDIEISDLVLDNVHVKVHEQAFKGNIVGIVLGYAFGNVVMKNVHIRNSSVEGFGKVGGFIGANLTNGAKHTFIDCSITNSELRGVYAVSPFVGLSSRGDSTDPNTVECINCKVEGVKWVYPEEQEANYIQLENAEISEDCPYIDQPITGLYWKYLSGDKTYYYGAFGNKCVSIGNQQTDYQLKDSDIYIANNELCLN